MPAVVASILAWLVGSAIARMLVGAGLTLITAAGLSTLINAALSVVSSGFSALPYALLQFALLCGVSDGLSIIGSAIVTRAFISSGSRIIGIKLKS